MLEKLVRFLEAFHGDIEVPRQEATVAFSNPFVNRFRFFLGRQLEIRERKVARLGIEEQLLFGQLAARRLILGVGHDEGHAGNGANGKHRGHQPEIRTEHRESPFFVGGMACYRRKSPNR